MRYHNILSVFRGKIRKNTYVSYLSGERFRFIELSYVVNGANPQAKINNIMKCLI